MMDLYYWTTPNGHKVALFLEEAGLPYTILPVNLSRGDQFKLEFLAISPNNRIPAIDGQNPGDGGATGPVFETGAILLYLAGKTGKFLPKDLRGRAGRPNDFFWQVDGLGPMAGQNHHFKQYAREKLNYAIGRYMNEINRLHAVFNKHLADRAFVAGEYSIAGMAVYPWIVPHESRGRKLADFPHLERWFEAIRARPATQRAYARAAEINQAPVVGDE
jgi:GST-like protein